jgi:hypothetical protein
MMAGEQGEAAFAAAAGGAVQLLLAWLSVARTCPPRGCVNGTLMPWPAPS